MDREAPVTRIRQSMRVLDQDGIQLGHVRDVSGQSILVQELRGRRVFWLSAADINEVGRDEISVGAAQLALADLPRA